MNRKDRAKSGARFGGGARAPGRIADMAIAMGGYHVLAFDPEGHIVAEREFENIVVDDGLNYLLEAGLAAGTQITAWFLGLMAGSPTTAAGDTMASHGGWTEQQGYDEAARQAWTPGAVSGKSVDNTGAVATYTIAADATTIGGAFLTSVNTKGGTTGRLYSAGAFTGGNVTLSAGSTLQVTGTFTQAAA